MARPPNLEGVIVISRIMSRDLQNHQTLILVAQLAMQSLPWKTRNTRGTKSVLRTTCRLICPSARDDPGGESINNPHNRIHPVCNKGGEVGSGVWCTDIWSLVPEITRWNALLMGCWQLLPYAASPEASYNHPRHQYKHSEHTETSSHSRSYTVGERAMTEHANRYDQSTGQIIC